MYIPTSALSPNTQPSEYIPPRNMFVEAALACRASPLIGVAATAVRTRWLGTCGAEGLGLDRRTGGTRGTSRIDGMAIVAKRSEKKRQARKLERRDDVREMQKMVEAREAAAAEAAAYRPEPPPPPESPAEAAQRILDAQVSFHEALATVKDEKQAVMESGAFDRSRGFKPFPAVQAAVEALALAKIAVYEAHLERALALLSQAKGEPPTTLEKFDWVYAKGVGDSNVRCLSFMLAAMHKNKVAPGVVEVLWVAVENGAVRDMDDKIVARALDLLGDLDDMGLLDQGEPEVLAASRDALAASSSAAAA